MNRIFAVSLALFTLPAGAQQVYKCVDGKGSASYQSTPCAPTHKTVKAWDATPEPVAPYRPPAQPAAQRSQSRRTSTVSGRGRGPSGSSISVENAGNAKACQAAKAKRDATLQKVGLKRTYDLLQRLDEAVRNACK